MTLVVLTKLLKTVVLRKDATILRQELPPLHEFTIKCRLTDLQHIAYCAFLKSEKISNGQAFLRSAQTFTCLCNHPKIMVRDRQSNAADAAAARRRASAALDASGTPSTPVAVDDESQRTEPGSIGYEDADLQVLSTGTTIDIDSSASASALADGWMRDTIDRYNDVGLLEHSYKMIVLMAILDACQQKGDKVLVFSRSIPTLDYVGEYLKQRNAAFIRMDGHTKMADRQRMIDLFNSEFSVDNIFLVSVHAGSLGVNMVTANRVVLLDLGWNPNHDEQAVARAYRYGQTKPVYVYRLYTYGTWEDKLYKSNVHKIGLAYRVIDEKNPGKHFTRKEMSEYFSEPPRNPASLLDARTFKEDDDVLAAVVSRHRNVIVDIGMQASLWHEDAEELTPMEIAAAHRQAEVEGEQDLGEQDSSGTQTLVRILGHPEPPRPQAPTGQLHR
ncbi:P-loop containing nucleoside triphosphate hydrolase protein [Thamnocephalis sphaerospora]|uniref:P-loop containing nucleoside triphosphate hydrolase protein n=1 Tax=Thamnocephalis sphaerospora TaxID=78915 RepID=A0A4P9XGX9_9FUNG|nr:P-loop containing nucleoside triphosphate hydrolase protein [Thamnocephalis sphaerospora]|eukprot:RKP04892.1 P-loop containing nucleoside triphosphate hydrolase protein [Thamnocephalis sphaerospora]